MHKLPCASVLTAGHACADVCCLACMYASAPTCMPLQLRCLFSSACAAAAGKARVRSVLSDQLVCSTIACLWHAFYRSASGSNHVCLCACGAACSLCLAFYACIATWARIYACMHAQQTLCVAPAARSDKGHSRGHTRRAPLVWCAARGSQASVAAARALVQP